MSVMAPYLMPSNEEDRTLDNLPGPEPTKELSDWELPLGFVSSRHVEPIEGAKQSDITWRMKEKYKTHCVALVLCLNIGVDPPDIVKTQPCARLECWTDPVTMSPTKALEVIGSNLQLQYERWQPRARYKQSLDPTSDEVKKLCCSLRRNAKDERVLFHYNGHGVPKPTNQGEIWVFNRAYTQYIPLSVYDLQSWMGAPSLYVYDCSNAGIIVEQFKAFAEQHERDYQVARQSASCSAQNDGSESPPPGPPSFKNCIQLAACDVNQILPMNPELPADLFTCCLTTPIRMALRWFILQKNSTKISPPGVTDFIDKIPGQLTDRRTMIGELNWIFTAITDTIAWSSLSTEVFQQLFRADLLTASLCRNFILADRILRAYNCTPVSSPPMPCMANHPMWQAWDQTLDLALSQLPAMLQKDAPYRHSPFFEEQLTAFQVWLSMGSMTRPPPDQLPMVLQVLLSTLHRVRALETLGRYLALGSWAVKAVLAVGIFPYCVKLLQASARDLRAPLVFIWAKIMAVDPTCQVDLMNAKGHRYFLSVLQDTSMPSEHRMLAAFVLAGIVDNYSIGQEAAFQGSLVSICLEQLGDTCAGLRQWLAISLGRLWKDYPAARWSGVRDLAHEKLAKLLEDACPAVRAAAAFALGTFVGGRERSEHANSLDHQVAVGVAWRLQHDASPLVRAEILAALQWVVLTFEPHFIAVALQEGKNPKTTSEKGSSGSQRHRMYSGGSVSNTIESARDALDIPVVNDSLLLSAHGGSTERIRRVGSSGSLVSPMATLHTLPTIGFGSNYMKLWSTLCNTCSDPHPQISKMCNQIVNHIKSQVIEIHLSRDIYGECRISSSSSGGGGSLPPSPNTRSVYLSSDYHHAGTRTLPGAGSRSRTKTTLPNTINEDVGGGGSMSSSPHDDGSLIGIKSPSKLGSSTFRKPIVMTNYVQWATNQFTKSSTEDSSQWKDKESRQYQERQWRYSRNKAIRKEAKEEQARARLRGFRLESQVFNTRSPLPPSVIIFHPYDQHIAIAAVDTFSIWDWGTGAKLCNGQFKRPSSRVSSLDYANAHDQSLLVVASACGSVALYRQPIHCGTGASSGGAIRSSGAGPSRGEPQLITAWQALDVALQSNGSDKKIASTQFAASSVSLNSNTSMGLSTSSVSQSSVVGDYVSPYIPPPPGTLVTWHQTSRTLQVAGDSKRLRIWDAETELRSLDVPTESESVVTAMNRQDNVLALGFNDGSCRLWDSRSANSGSVATLRDHQGRLLAATLRNGNKLVTACTSGEARFYDLRYYSMVKSVETLPGISAMSVHQYADMFACGSNQHIGVFDINGHSMNPIKLHEGFMGPRIGPVSCLSFHPLRCALAVGARDAVSVYSSDMKR